MQDANEIKEKITSSLKSKGPSLPVHISTEIKSSILFSSAFLGELVSEKKVKMSHMRVGSSPIYFLPGQEPSLENFSDNLKSKEKDAFILLKEKRFLVDSVQSPAIRVALREIRDFAIPFKSGEEIIWRYFLVPELEFKAEEKTLIVESKKPVVEEIVKEKPLEVLEKEKDLETKTEKRERKEKPKKRKKTAKKDDEFFSNVKGFLSQNSIDLLDIENFGVKEIVLKVKDKEGEKLLIAYKKNKITTEDIIKAGKRASDKNLPYMILGIGGPLKKIENLIGALKGLSSIKKIK